MMNEQHLLILKDQQNEEKNNFPIKFYCFPVGLIITGVATECRITECRAKCTARCLQDVFLPLQGFPGAAGGSSVCAIVSPSGERDLPPEQLTDLETFRMH